MWYIRRTYHCLWEFTVDILHQLQELVHLWGDGKRQIMYLCTYVCAPLHAHTLQHKFEQTQESRMYMCVHSQGPSTHHPPPPHTNTLHSPTCSTYVCTHPTHTSGETGGLNCLCNSMMILKQTRPFSSFSVSSNENITDKVGCIKQTGEPKMFNTLEVHYICIHTFVYICT